ncbi:MAG TPA: S28 family serine protease [Bdellovibrionales bacterium]|nr:S28 family serine protease [Bdellovibrionales bacterium]
MKKFFGVFALVLSFSASAFATSTELGCIDQATTIEKKLGCLKGVTFTDITGPSTPTGARQFDIRFEQIIDHANPAMGTFKQRLILLHRGEAEPMVLQTSGYAIFGVAQSALAAAFGTNQLQIEHRFFADSKPTPLDWSKLDIKQSADDFHAITVAFKQIYGKAWVNTGASKGGMTSVYHRRFYPNDLDGTVADVAPLSFATDDQRFVTFVDNAGGEQYAECRAQIKKMQVALLENRDQFVPRLKGNFGQLGSVDIAFEHSILEMPFYFWQYGNPDDASRGCRAVAASKTLEQMFNLLESHAAIGDYSDESIAGFQPYYYQSATQLGGPGNSTAHLDHLRKYEASIDQYTPKGVEYSYSNEAMKDVDHWVRTDADKIVFVYGAFDPWSGGEFPVSETGKDVFKFWVPRGNHSSKFTALPKDKKAEFVQILTRWFGKAPVNLEFARRGPMLDDIEFAARQRHRLK